jgi:hypothetical protein
MTDANGSCFLFLYSPRLRGWEYRGVLCSRTKDFHSQMKEPESRHHHLLFDEEAEEIFAATDEVGASAQDWRDHDPLLVCSMTAFNFDGAWEAAQSEYHAEESAKRTKLSSRTSGSVRLRSHSRAIT